MTVKQLKADLLDRLDAFRKQGKHVSDINPILALADEISDKLYKGQISQDEVNDFLAHMGSELWDQQTARLHVKTGRDIADDKILDGIDMNGIDVGKPIYHAVFTAHPVFALKKETSSVLSQAASDHKMGTMPDDAYQPRSMITLQDEHEEAMQALGHARAAIRSLHHTILASKRKAGNADWRDVLPVMCAVSTWVGYDLDGRSDITWLDSFALRLVEKHMALDLYVAELSPYVRSHADIAVLLAELTAENDATQADIKRFSDLTEASFTTAVDALSERKDKLISSTGFANRLHDIAKAIDDDETATALMVIAGDIASHGFGMGEIHLRINAVQLRNAMRAVDGRGISLSGDNVPNRLLMERLATRIKTEPAWDINFQNLDEESATARRQLMLATQFLKHVDCDQPVRLLIAECEKPITIMNALYLAHKFGIADRLDISPLFETTFGLEHGVQLIDQLLGHDVFCDYVRRRGRLAMQTGFSDAGRFIGQIAANLAIERLQLKIAQLVKDRLNGDVDLLMFNTHGESFGRGCAGPRLADRQNFILTPHTRARCRDMGVRIHHQSSFQGGDGYRMFGTLELARSTIYHLFAAETAPPSAGWQDDSFYQNNDFALDMFLTLKAWHEKLFSDPSYVTLLDIFGINLLPKTGSRPAKRVVQVGMGRQDPSKMRAIPHNAILQQLGFLANVISGFGSAAQIDADQFADIYQTSPRLQQLLGHVLAAKSLGSLNTVLAYAKLLDNGFWIDRGYHGYQPRNLRAYRKLGFMLNDDRRTRAARQIVWRLRDDLIDLYRLSKSVGEEDVRISGDERVSLDMIHAVRIALIIDSLALICRVPRFAESTRHSNEDVLRQALSLDFDEAQAIIRQEFSLDKTKHAHSEVAETQNYRDESHSDYQAIAEQILAPLERNNQMIKRITQMISGHYGAHG